VFGQTVGIYRTDNKGLQLRGFLVTSTETNCSGDFDWSATTIVQKIKRI